MKLLKVVKARLRKKERASVRKEKSKKKKNHEKVVCGFEIYCKVGLC